MDLALEQMLSSPVAYVLAFVLGTLWGSFANVCIYRWPPSEQHPRGRSVVAPGSHCFVCKTPIRWYDNVPLLSYLWLRGQCRSCKTGFSGRYLIVEAVTGLLFAVAWWSVLHFHGLWTPMDERLVRFAIYAGFSFVMVVVTFIDIDHKLILDRVTFPSVVVFYAASLLLPERRWHQGFVGVAVGYGVIWLVGEVYFRLRRREGMGLGDAKLLAVVGALLGWKGVVVSLFAGAALGSVIGIAALLWARRGQPSGSDEPLHQSELPFGPFLAAGALFYLLGEPYLAVQFRLLAG
jgi:leader peptidase (prepilin peptidase)/N-methyltransferase